MKKSPYNHEESDLNIAIGVDGNKLVKKVGDLLRPLNGKNTSEVVEIIEKTFNKRELAYLFIMHEQQESVIKFSGKLSDIKSKTILDEVIQLFKEEIEEECQCDACKLDRQLKSSRINLSKGGKA